MNTVRSTAVAGAPAARPRRRLSRAVVASLAGRLAPGALALAMLVAGGWSLDRAGLSPLASVQAAEPADPATFGRDLAGSCAGCHNTAGRAIGDGVPLAGMPADRMVQLMSEFRDGKRPATVMHQIAKGYTPEQIKLIAAWLAAQSPK